MRTLAMSVLVSAAIALVVYAATGGRVIFLPLLLLLPFAFFSFGRGRR